MIPRYLDPKSDLVFKKIFGHHPELLRSFLNAILPLPEDCVIESLVYLPIESVPEIEGLKHSIVDVRCKDNHGRHFIVEMQLQWSNHFIKRMLFNTAATYVRQLEKGELYDHLSPVYGLALVNDNFSKESDWFHHYQMTDANNKKLEDIQLVLIELPKFKPTTITAKRLAILWLRFFKEVNEHTEEVDQSLLEEESIKRALNLLQTSAYTAAELRAYDKNWDAISSEKTLLNDKYVQGKVEGKAEGRAEGIDEGIAKGRAEMILSMYHSGLSLEEIARISKISLNEVDQMIRNLK